MSKVDELIDKIGGWLTGIEREQLQSDLRAEFARLQKELSAERNNHEFIPVTEETPDEGVVVEINMGEDGITVGRWLFEGFGDESENDGYEQWEYWSFYENAFVKLEDNPISWRFIPTSLNLRGEE